eukprot:TRINITY_DN1684_c0_g1_i2.p1 TRINITY_DN1684_c0_g1~~TRINITY_DN1684_c0_g1_i2.p1  ORF type:complete len:122 (-),score=26.28 TRINITY_DN1684_c0_g1_i2:436-801(-)
MGTCGSTDEDKARAPPPRPGTSLEVVLWIVDPLPKRQITASLADKVGEVAERVADTLGYGPMPVLYFCDSPMDEEKTLASYGIKTEAEIKVVQQVSAQLTEPIPRGRSGTDQWSELGTPRS